MRQGSEIFFWPPQFFQIFADFSPSNCSSSKTVSSFSFSFFFPKSQDPYVLPGQKIVKKAYFWIFIFFDEFSGLYTDLRPRMGNSLLLMCPPTYESVLVTAHGVVGEGEPQAHDGAREECHEHRLDGDRETLIMVFHE